MTLAQMQTALETGFNPQGRHLSESMVLKYRAALDADHPKPFAHKLYRGFEISGRAGHWYVRGESNWSTIYTSEKKARLAVDACLGIRHISAQTLYQ